MAGSTTKNLFQKLLTSLSLSLILSPPKLESIQYKVVNDVSYE